MTHILKKELGSYFKGMSGYFFGAIMLVFAGIYTVMVNCIMGYSNYEYTINNLSFMYLALVPVLTMKTFADERRQRTDQLLYSLPLRMSQVVIGKYVALLIVMLVPTLVICFYPIVLTPFTEIKYPVVMLNILAFYMLGASMIAIGEFISTLTDSQAVSAGLSFAVFLISYFARDMADYVPGTAFASMLVLAAFGFLLAFFVYLFTKMVYLAGIFFCVYFCILVILYTNFRLAFEGLFSDIVNSISIFERFYVFARGVFDIKSIIYFISIIIVFLYLSVISLEKRRWA